MGVDLPAFPGLVAAGQRAGLALEGVADHLHVRAEDLAVVIDIESRWDPKAENPSTHATGLIQWMPKTAVGLGLASSPEAAPDAIKDLDAEQQLYHLPDYFRAALAGRDPAGFPSAEDTGQIDIGDLYLLVFAPSFAGGGGTIFPAGSKGAEQNKGLQGADGSITVESVRDAVESASAAADKLPRIATDTWQAPPPYKPRDPPRYVPPPPRPAGKEADWGLGWLLLLFGATAVIVALRTKSEKKREAAA
jgi:hypothetical protein